MFILKRYCIIYILILGPMLSLCGCRDSEISFDNNPKGNFDALWTIIDRNYCFFEYKNIDWDAVYKKYEKRISPQITNDGLFDLMSSMLSELKDGHVNLAAKHDISRYWSWYEDFPENFDTNIQKKYLGGDFFMTSGMKYKILEDNVGYIYYDSFMSNVGESGLDQILSRMSICNGIILDVRNNGGGSLTNVNRIAGRFFNKRKLVGYISHKDGFDHKDFSELYPIYIESSNRVRYQKPVVVLSNRSCYSAANEFVSVIKYSPIVTVIGDTTGGGSGLPFSSELPNGWSIRFSASPYYNAEKKHIEFGVDPDEVVMMTLQDKERGLDTIIERARQIINEKAQSR